MVDVDIYVYEDTHTGKRYVYDGKQLIELNKAKETGKIDLSKVDEETLEKEEEERQKQIEKELEELGDTEPGSEEAEAKVEDISKLFADEELAKDLMAETEKHVERDRKKRAAEKKAAADAASKYSANTGIDKFVIDLNRLIAKEVKAIRSTSWNKINKKYSTTKIIKPGYAEKPNGKIPKLFVYFDQSDSWDSKDLEIGKQAVETLRGYEEKGQLVIELYYFANRIGTSPTGIGYGTAAGGELMRHIKQNKPDNVVIMTDHDFDRWDEILEESGTVVPGGAFLLFRNGLVSHRLVDRVKGKKLTRIYSF